MTDLKVDVTDLKKNYGRQYLFCCLRGLYGNALQEIETKDTGREGVVGIANEEIGFRYHYGQGIDVDSV